MFHPATCSKLQQPFANQVGIHFFPFQLVIAEVGLVMKALVDEKHFKKKLKQALKCACMHLRPS